MIELIVAIVVLGILAAIVIPNISSVQEDASETTMIADNQNIQVAVDMYQLKELGKHPVVGEQPTVGIPKQVDFTELKPTYLRKVPKYNMNYWIDYQGTLYTSTIENPTDFTQEATGLSWTPVAGAETYLIYEATGNVTNVVKEVNKETFKDEITGYDPNKVYLISAVDQYGFQTAPAKSNGTGNTPAPPESP